MGGRFALLLWIMIFFLSGCEREEVILIGEASGRQVSSVSSEEPEESTEEEEQTSMQEMNTVVVFVCGAVQYPGLVTLPAGSRVGDALELAGGFTAEADPSWVNLAQTVGDGDKIYFPTREELTRAASADEEQKDSLVNLNTASEKELCSLPGIGESKAADIIAYRQEKGAFQSIRDVMKVPGIKQALYDRIKNRITVE